MSNSERMIIVLNEQFLPPKEFTNQRLVFGAAEAVNENDRNTRVDIDGVAGRGYYGGVTVYYNRLVLSDYVTDFTFRSDQQMTKAIIIDNLAARYDLQIDQDDFDDFSIPTFDAEGQNAIIQASIKTTSLQWVGDLQITLEYGKSWLDASVTKQVLDRTVHPNPNPTRAYGRTSTWGIDFSGIQTALKPTAAGDYTDWDTVVALCDALGIPQWLKGKVVDQLVSATPGANPDFQRVVIQNTVTSAALQGPMYFHYNPF